MNRSDKTVLNKLSKEQLIYLIEQQYHSLFIISEICVSESKLHIKSEDAISKIREYIYDMPSLYDPKELKAFIDMKMGKISAKKYRKIMGFD